MNKILLGLFLVVLALAARSDAFQCYVCRGTACEDADDSLKGTCSDEGPRDDGTLGGDVWYCYSKGKDGVQQKGCTRQTESLFCVELVEDCHVCDEEGCNSATGLAASVGVVTAAAILLKLYQ